MHKDRAGRAFAVAIGVSAAVHVLAFGVVSVRGMGRPQQVEAEIVPVEFDVQAQVAPAVRQTPEPDVTAERSQPVQKEQSEQPRSFVARIAQRVTGSGKQASNGPVRGASGRSGAPVSSGGGGVGVGSYSSSGSFAMAGGDTPAGWVPGEGSGRGAGTGAGRGPRAPEAVQPAAPAPPPAPRQVQVSVCAASGDLPGRHCSSTVKRTFVEGRQPGRTCTICKAPAPKPDPEPASHKSVEAEVTAARKLSGSAPSCPVRLRSDVSVTCEFQIGTGGGVSDVSVVDSSGISAVDRAAVDALKGWKYAPATQNSAPRSVRKRVTFSFKS